MGSERSECEWENYESESEGGSESKSSGGVSGVSGESRVNRRVNIRE